MSGGRKPRNFAQLAYSPAVKAMQARLGARSENAEIERTAGNTEITPPLAAYLAGRTSFYLATASKRGRPYIQHRGGPAGFLRTLDPRTLGFFDVKGNSQYITLGNLSENPEAMILVTDYARRRRLKIWGRAEMVEDDRGFIDSVLPAQMTNRFVPRAIRFKVAAWDMNCPQFIPQLFSVDELEAATAGLQSRIAELEAEVAALRRKTRSRRKT